jgi:predicted nucleic acid-binding protein
MFLLDTSAWLALDEAEPGGDEVEAILANAWLGDAVVHSSFVTLTELEYIRTQESDAQQAAELLVFAKAQRIAWHHSDDALGSEAAKLKAAHKVSFADAFVAATAKRLNATLVHKDPEFEALRGVIRLHALPLKNAPIAPRS